MIGPLWEPLIAGLHISQLGIIPKGHVLGKRRGCSQICPPQEASVNDAINTKLWSLQYTSVDRAVDAAQLFGPSVILTKIDIKAAYHLIPDHLDDWPLLGLCWKECYYTLMGCCYSASGLHQKSTQQSWMRWSGVFTSGTN